MEAYDTNKPIDSPLVEGCYQSIFTAFIPQPGMDCQIQTFTDDNGYFDLQFEVEKRILEG